MLSEASTHTFGQQSEHLIQIVKTHHDGRHHEEVSSPRLESIQVIQSVPYVTLVYPDAKLTKMNMMHTILTLKMDENFADKIDYQPVDPEVTRGYSSSYELQVVGWVYVQHSSEYQIDLEDNDEMLEFVKISSFEYAYGLLAMASKFLLL